MKKNPSRWRLFTRRVLLVLGVAASTSSVALAQSRSAATHANATVAGTCPAATTAVGAIEGSTYFPGRAPSMTIVAISTSTPGCAYYVQTRPHVDRYGLYGLPEGTYHIVGYVTDTRGEWGGGFTDSITCMATCGIRGDCCRNAHHVLHDVTVRAGRTLRHVTVSDWTLITGPHATWSPPARPVGVPAAPSP